METLLLTTILTMALITYGIIEFRSHSKNIQSIPIRIHVNGTRGKSSVSRLIGAGMRSGGIKTVTKVTGTYPRLIFEDGSEHPIIRKSSANIIEQLSVIKIASDRNAEAVVAECMALQPAYQKISEEKMIRSTLGVITNVRSDHLDVMGPTTDDVAEALSLTIPRNGILVTSGNEIHKFIKETAAAKNCKLIPADLNDISDKDMSGFSYLEHKENVAIAIKVCDHFGIGKEKALREMYKTIPDEGALVKYKIKTGNSFLYFINAFAANDPDSSYIIWKMLKKENHIPDPFSILLNTREDRLNRSRQLLKMIGEKIGPSISTLFLMGDSTDMVKKSAVKNRIPPQKIKPVQSVRTDKIFDSIISSCKNGGSLLALGNMGGGGGALSDYFKERSESK